MFTFFHLSLSLFGFVCREIHKNADANMIMKISSHLYVHISASDWKKFLRPTLLSFPFWFKTRFVLQAVSSKCNMRYFKLVATVQLGSLFFFHSIPFALLLLSHLMWFTHDQFCFRIIYLYLVWKKWTDHIFCNKYSVSNKRVFEVTFLFSCKNWNKSLKSVSFH